MSGTDRSRAGEAGDGRGAPVVVLVEPQLPENIGMVARAMLNCGLTRLRLVRPRELWPNDKAVAAASGADRVLDDARLYPSTAAAIADLEYVCATTARPRYMTKQVLTPRSAAMALRTREAGGVATGLLFGREASGLDNDDVALAQAVVTVPLNAGFSSLNLGMAVLLLGYEWFAAGAVAVAEAELVMPEPTKPATQAELQGFYDHLEGELDACGFLRNTDKRPSMVRNLRNLFGRAQLTQQEIRTLRGVVTCLVEARHAKR
ncbi:MAG: RNA methyltransferase [Rhodospirillales bacterium]|nr:RNA methyltransferase [Rhodospirillales bacterium]